MTIERLSNELKRKRTIALLKDYRTAMTRVHLKPNLFLPSDTYECTTKPTTLTWMPRALILLVPTCVHASLFPPVMESRAMVIIEHIKLKVREYMFIVISFYASCMYMKTEVLCGWCVLHDLYLLFYFTFISDHDWICKNMATEISLIYLLTESCSGVCFFCFCFCFFFSQLLYIYLIGTG